VLALYGTSLYCFPSCSQTCRDCLKRQRMLKAIKTGLQDYYDRGRLNKDGYERLNNRVDEIKKLRS
jgi:hypothetical protein